MAAQPKTTKRKYRQRVKPVPPPPPPGNKYAAGSNSGAPSLYRPEYSVQAAKLCQLGATIMEVADFFGVSGQTIYCWQSRYREFHDAMEIGKAPADNRVERSFYQRAIGYNITVRRKVGKDENGDLITDTEMHIPGDPTVQAKWLANRRRKKWGTQMDDAPQERSSEEIKAIILGKLAEWGLKVVPADAPIDATIEGSATTMIEGTTAKPNGGTNGSNGGNGNGSGPDG